MKKHKENGFSKKFRMLSSQGSVEEINWSSSDSSELESATANTDKLNCITNKKSRKRKRSRKVHKNISNLDITFIDSSKPDKKHSIALETSNINENVDDRTSPILCKSVYFPPYKCQNTLSSPILSSRALQLKPKKEETLKSPILLLKSASPKMSQKVRKKLFKCVSNNNEELLDKNFKHSNESLDRRKCNTEKRDYLKNLNQTYRLKNDDNEKINKYQLLITKESPTCTFLKNEEQSTNYTIQETQDVETMDDSVVMLKTRSKDLVEKVKTYFDSHFSSDTVSQDTISDIPTPRNNSKTSDDIEITNTITQVSNRNSSDSLKQEQDVQSTEVLSKKDKIFRYKKDGLAYRLNCLLKKQTASISLWQHERFMAANSNFVIPKGEFMAFRICKTHLKYGLYLLDAMDFNDDNFLIVIRRSYVSNDIIMEGARDIILKLYMPYKIKDFSDGCKLIINVCKFELVSVNS